MSLPLSLRDLAQRIPDAIAIRTGALSTTYGVLWRRANELADWLRELEREVPCY